MDQIAQGIWRWTARHPEWHPRGTFGAEVASYLLADDPDTVLIDPIAPGGDVDRLIGALEPLVSGHLRIMVTIPYHVRDAESVWRHFDRTGSATIWGHPAAAKRLADRRGFRELVAGSALESEILPIAIGNPRRYETPLYIPRRRALVFGDAVVAADGAVRVWIQQPLTAARMEWYERRFRPSLEPLLDVDCERLLLTHGPPVLADGRAVLRAALDAGPWYHPPN